MFAVKAQSSRYDPGNRASSLAKDSKLISIGGIISTLVIIIILLAIWLCNAAVFSSPDSNPTVSNVYGTNIKSIAYMRQPSSCLYKVHGKCYSRKANSISNCCSVNEVYYEGYCYVSSSSPCKWRIEKDFACYSDRHLMNTCCINSETPYNGFCYS